MHPSYQIIIAISDKQGIFCILGMNCFGLALGEQKTLDGIGITILIWNGQISSISLTNLTLSKYAVLCHCLVVGGIMRFAMKRNDFFVSTLKVIFFLYVYQKKYCVNNKCVNHQFVSTFIMSF